MEHQSQKDGVPQAWHDHAARLHSVRWSLTTAIMGAARLHLSDDRMRDLLDLTFDVVGGVRSPACEEQNAVVEWVIERLDAVLHNPALPQGLCPLLIEARSALVQLYA